MVVYSILGDYFDCQLYAGNLFLWSFSGSLKVYDFNKLIQAFQSQSNQIVSEQSLQRYLVGGLDRIETRFPTDSEVYGGNYYLSSKSGLFKAPLKRLEQGFEKVWDCPVLSVSAKRKKGVTFAGGREGVFVYSDVAAIQELYCMRDQSILQVSAEHADYSAFCSRGLYATSTLGKSYFLEISHMEGLGQEIPVDTIFPNHNVALSWSYRDKIYAYIDDRIVIKRIVKKQEGVSFVPLADYLFYPQKGRVLSGTSTDFVDIVELEHAFVIIPTHKGADSNTETIWDPVTRWRAFPKSIGYNHIVMVILESELRVYVYAEDECDDDSDDDSVFSPRYNRRQYRSK